ncbi:hypothetical protein, partial [Spiroplasma endosymbiont of Megaselia nigra]|uniref:hypothetical protein n=1 Tax=Spiroplasma endosymbiont of Megaselia nigra TaxID=2478537 RepID=UPI000FC254DD
DKCKGTVLNKDGKPTEELVYSTYNLKQLNPKTNRVYLINEQTKAVDAQTPASDSEKDNDLEFLQTPDGTNCSYIIDMFSIQALYKGNFEIIFYADNPYTNNEEDYLRLSVWSFRGKTKSTLNNYLRDMTTNYKTSFLLPHDYEIPTFNYPEYVLPPVPYNYKTYTQDIWAVNTIQPLKTKITALAQCKKKNNDDTINLFDDKFNYAYYEIEIDLKKIDPTIQSIDKFISSYKTIEISNLSNLQVECVPPEIEKFIPKRYFNIIFGDIDCRGGSISLARDLKLQQKGLLQQDNINFPNNFTINTEKITNDIKTIDTFKTNGLLSRDYFSLYNYFHQNFLKLLVQITKLSDNDNNKIKETYLQAYYTNDLKLKIRFTKSVLSKFILGLGNYKIFNYFGNDEDLIIDINNENVLGIRNKSTNPVKITIKPR